MSKEELFYIEEISISYKNTTPKNKRWKITSSTDARDIFKISMGDIIDYKEVFYILLLNNSNDVLGVSKVSEGGIASTLVDVRLLFQITLKAHATSFIVAHNHPSGNLEPSKADKKLTQKIKGAGELLDIKLLDHLIITQDSYLSFADENLL